MIVCEKEIPNGSAKFRLVGTMKSPDDWTNDDIRTIVEAAKSGFDVPRIVKVREFSQSCLSSKGEMLPELVLQLIPEYENASKLVVDVFGDSRIPMTSIGELRKRGITYRERIEKARHLHELGASALLACRGEERALKQIDRLIFKSHKDGATVFRDRLGDAEFEFLDVELCPSLRRMSYLPHIDMSDDSDFCVSVPSKTLQSAMNRFYSTKEVARIMKHLKQDKMWEKCVEENASRIMCARRIDFSAPGSNCICCWNKRAMFNVSHFMADGFQTELQEKFFCMWMNSTMGIIQLLSTAASTRGAWVGLQKSSVDKMRIPDIGRLESKDWKEVSNLWTRVSKMDLPSLIDQLEKNEGFRVELDDGLLRLLGIDDENARKNIASELRKGGLAAISALKHSMSGDRQGDFVED
jgi:hypothetical protein